MTLVAGNESIGAHTTFSPLVDTMGTAAPLEQMVPAYVADPVDLTPPVTESPAAERLPLCEIIGEEEITAEDVGIPPELAPRKIVHVRMRDPGVEAMDPEVVTAIQVWESIISARVRERRARGEYTRLPGRDGGTYMDASGTYINGRDKKYWGDQQTLTDILNDFDSEGLRAWHGTLPTGKALAILSDIDHVDEVYNNKGKYLGRMDEVGRTILRVVRDRRAIVTRLTDEAVVMARMAEGGTLAGKRIMSYGSGSTPGPMKASQIIRKQYPDAQDPDLIIADIDPHAANDAADLATNALDFKGTITPHVKNLLNPLTMGVLGLKLRLTGRRPDISEAYGFFEYIDHELLKPVYARRGLKPPKDPEVKFLRRMYQTSKRHVMISQMRSDRPDPEFIDAVGWGHIVMRSPRELMEIVKKAGIPLDQVELRLPDPGVYAEVIIDKKAGPQAERAEASVFAKGRRVLRKLVGQAVA